MNGDAVVGGKCGTKVRLCSCMDCDRHPRNGTGNRQQMVVDGNHPDDRPVFCSVECMMRYSEDNPGWPGPEDGR